MSVAEEPRAGKAGPEERLETWKQIAAHLGRDERTAKRWEAQRGLPVRRPPGQGRSTVYAYVGELEAWRRSRPLGEEPEAFPPAPSDPEAASPIDTAPAESEPAATEAIPPSADPTSLPTAASSRLRDRAIAWCLAAAVLLAVVLLVIREHPRHARDGARPADLSAAREDYTRGLYAWQTRTPEGLNQAVDSFTQAIVKDPGYAPAYVGLADCYNLLREYTLMPPAEAYARAKAAAERALALDDSLAGAHRSLAFVDFWWSRDVPGARREFARALALDPNSAQTHHWYATFLVALDEPERALTEIDRALQLDPSSRAIMADRGLILDVAGRRREAVRLLTLVESMDPRFLSPHDYLASIYLDEGDDQGYLRESKTAAQLRVDQARSALGRAAERGLSDGGHRGMLEAIASEQEQQRAKGAPISFELAQTYARLGDHRRALAALRRAAASHDARLGNLDVQPQFAQFRTDPNFNSLAASTKIQ